MPRSQGTSRKGKPKKDMRAAGFGKALQRCVFFCNVLSFFEKKSHHDWDNLLHTQPTHTTVHDINDVVYMYMKNEWGNDIINFSIQPEQKWMLIHISVVLTFFNTYMYHQTLWLPCAILFWVYEEVFAPIYVDGVYISNKTIGHDEKI